MSLTTRLASLLFVTVAACGSSPRAAGPPRNASSPTAGVGPTAQACGVTANDNGKLGTRVRRALQDGEPERVSVEVHFTSVTDDELQAFGLSSAGYGDAVGSVDRATLLRLCADSRVTRVEKSPELRPS
ncbi:MAG TPA: hypothetical protein VFQ53_22865 [Kofleriaceae bacterium]|nr:hypothetical protein [Kofleriaceae bacterium]